MAAPTFVSRTTGAAFSTSNSVGTTNRTSGSISVTSGDRIVVLAAGENYTGGGFRVTYGTVSDTQSNTYTQAQLVQVNDYATVAVWTATAGSTGSLTVTLPITVASSAALAGFTVLVFRGSDGIGASSKTNVASGAPSLSLTTTQDNSTVATVNSDWNATDGASRTWRTINSSTGSEQDYYRDSAHYTVYVNYWSDVGTAGAKTTGLSAPTGQKYAIISIEVKGAASSGQSAALGTVTETQTAQALGKRKTRALGIATTTEIAQALGRRKTRALGTATETNTALALAYRKTRALGVSAETDSAQALGRAKAKAISLAAETDAAQAVGPRKARALGLAAETDTAVTLARRKSIGAATEADSAQVLGRRKASALGLATETDTAVTITAAGGPLTAALGTTVETDAALTFGRAKVKAVSLAAETDAAQVLGRAKARAIGSATESDVAGTLGVYLRKLLGTALESDLALALGLGAVGDQPGRAVLYLVARDEARLTVTPRDSAVLLLEARDGALLI